MMCTACGCRQVAGAQFCRQCGVRMQQTAWMPGPYAAMPYTRVEQNMQPLGIAWMFYGGFYMLSALVGGLVLHAFLNNHVFGDQAPPFVYALAGTLLPAMAVIVIAMGSLAIFAGYGLTKARPWARTLTIVLAILALVKVPLGTALGIYSLWVLAPRASCAEWRELQEA